MTQRIYQDGMIAAIIALRHTLTRAMIEATTACKDLENGNSRAAVGALVPVGPALRDAQALLDSIFIFNRELNEESGHAK